MDLTTVELVENEAKREHVRLVSVRARTYTQRRTWRRRTACSERPSIGRRRELARDTTTDVACLDAACQAAHRPGRAILAQATKIGRLGSLPGPGSFKQTSMRCVRARERRIRKLNVYIWDGAITTRACREAYFLVLKFSFGTHCRLLCG